MIKNDVKKIIFSSSCATYGNPKYSPIDEEHPQIPINPYGHTKVMVERILEDYSKAYGLKYISLRYFNAAGCDSEGMIGEQHEPETHLIPLVLRAIKGKKDALEIYGTDYNTKDGTCVRDYIHVEDLAAAHYLATCKISEFTGCINLGSGVETSVLDIIKAAEEVTGQKCPISFCSRRDGDPDRLFSSTHLAKKILVGNRNTKISKKLLILLGRGKKIV